MHELFALVLNSKDLSKAGDLFSLEDQDIENDLSEVLLKIQEIASSQEYLSSDNDQSVVEICITRVTSAIRETGSIERNASALVSVLESCLQHNLKPSARDEDPPHTKIASDILSCLFLNYSKKSVMKEALPIAVRFLHQGNKELSRNMSSYLSLAAIDNSKLLAEHIQPIIDSIIKGNRSLARVLPQVYTQNREPVDNYVSGLVSILPDCDASEKNSLLQLFVIVAKDHPRVLEPHISLLTSQLSSPSTSTLVLQSYSYMASVNAHPFVSHVTTLKHTAECQPGSLNLVAKILGPAGKTSQSEGREVVSWLTAQLANADHHTMPTILLEVKAIAEVYPSILSEFMGEILRYSQSAPVSASITIQQLKEMYLNSGSTANLPSRRSVWSQTEGVVTVITVGDPPSAHHHASHLHMYTMAPVTNLPNSKNASTSTREISFPGMQATMATSSRDTSFPVMQMTMATSTVTTGNGTTTSFPSMHATMPTSAVAGGNVTVHVTTSSALLPGTVSAMGGIPTGNHSKPTGHRQSLSSVNSTNHVAHPGGMTSHSEDGKTALLSTIAPSLPPVQYTTASTVRHHPPAITNTYTGQPHAIPFRDAVLQFCEKHLNIIKSFIENVSARLPIPIKATLEESKHKRYCKIHFICYGLEEHCLYAKKFFYVKTRNARTWIHLMFLAIQARSDHAVSQQDPSVGNLKACWDQFKSHSGNSFVRLVTSSFPSAKDQDALLQELQGIRYYDVFEFNAARKHWACFLCNHPERALGLLQNGDPAIEGQLKEKKGRWKLFKRWKTRYFTLSGATITYSKKNSRKETLPISKIHTVKAVRKGMRDIPKAFEIFTSDQSYVFKVKDGKNAEQWVQCLQIAVARSQMAEVKDEDLKGWNLPARTSGGATLPHSSQTKL